MERKTLIVIPTYNERENIETLILEILTLHHPFHILVVDDFSPDGTWKVVSHIAEEEERVNLIIRRKKEGLGKAYREGFQWGLKENFEIIFQMDADFSHHPLYLPVFLERMKEADVVIGSRYVWGGRVSEWSKGREILSRAGNLYTRLFLRLPIKDITSGFRCYRREVLESMPWERFSSHGFAFQIEMTYYAYRKGFRIVETPITFQGRKKGASKMGWGIIREAIFLIPALRVRGFLDRI